MGFRLNIRENSNERSPFRQFRAYALADNHRILAMLSRLTDVRAGWHQRRGAGSSDKFLEANAQVIAAASRPLRT